MKVKQYANWVNCIGEDCPNGLNGKCTFNGTKDFPKNGKCYNPTIEKFEEFYANLGAYEMEAV